MGKHCCVSGCNTGVTLPSHMFPKDVNMMNKWRKAIYSEKIRDLTDEQLRKCVVCYRHFADSDYEATYRLRRLKPGIIPTLFLPDNGNNNSEVDNGNNNTEATTRESEAMDTNTTEQMEEIEIIEIIQEEEESAINALQSTTCPVNGDPPKSPLAKNTTHNLLDLDAVLQGKYFHKFTPKMWKLYKLSCVLKKKQEMVVKRQLSFRERIRQAKQYSKSPAVERLLSSLTSVEQAFLQMQIKATLGKYAPKDECFTLDEKIGALAIMKQSSESYRYLSQVFNLPSMHSLQSILEKINIHPGPVNFLNQDLKKQVRSMKERDKVCLLMWDEMLLQLHMDYDATKKHILGFEDFGKKRRARFADHALVFMLRGIQSGWKLPLAYYFSDGAVNSDQLVEWIKDITKIIIDSGLYPMAFICNDKKRNITAINKLRLESARLKSKRGQLYHGYITINNQDIIPLYDPSHLVKSVCDNLSNNDLEFDCAEGEERKFASWEIIEQAYHMDSTDSSYRLMPKITAEHVVKGKVKKKKVKNAIQVLSMTMGAFIHHHTKLEGHVNTIYGPLKMPEKRGRDTAEMVLFFDQLFDSVNGHTLKPEKPLRIAVSHNSSHLSFWQRAIKRLRKMRFVDATDRNHLKDSTILKNWISTLQGFCRLWIILKETYEFKYLKARILNQDSLRHFFKQIRSLDAKDANPTCAEFESSFKTLLINNLALPRNMENDNENKVDGSLLFTLKDLIYKLEIRCNDKDGSLPKDAHMLDLEMEMKLLEETCNYQNIATRILNNSRIKGCDTCKNLLTDTMKSELVFSDNLLKTFRDADDILVQEMSNVCYSHHTTLTLETELYMQMDLRWLNCQQHNVLLKELLVSYMVEFYIYKWCNGINDIFAGKDHEDSS